LETQQTFKLENHCLESLEISHLIVL
jgi:hypothetical protein